MYQINFNNGVTWNGYDDIDTAKADADKGVNFTRCSVSIENEIDGTAVALRGWCSLDIACVDMDDIGDIADCIIFGQHGFYEPWVDAD